MKKILLIMPYFYPHKGGSQKYAEELYTHLLQGNPCEFQVDVLCYNTDQAPSKEKYRGMRIYRIPCWQIISGRFTLPKPWYLIKALYSFSKNHYDFINTHLTFFDPTWWGWIYAKLIGARSIFTEHVASFPVHQNKLVQSISKLACKTIGRFSLAFYDLITVTNKQAGKFLENEIGVKNEINLIYGGVDTNFFSPRTGKKKRIIPVIRKEFKKNDVLITYVGRLIWTKGVEQLYHAIKLIEALLPSNVYFILAGGGELENKLRKSIGQDELSERVFLTGPIEYNQVRDLLKASDIFINPSHHNEGFPNTVLEAGACENLVIATDNGGTSEIIKNKKTGLLISQKDTEALAKILLWAVKNHEKGISFAKNLRKVLKEKYDWRLISNQLVRFLNQTEVSTEKRINFNQPLFIKGNSKTTY